MLDGLRSAYPETGKSGMADALREAIALLRTHPDNQPNEPVTLEELRGMKKPVWMDCKTVDGEAGYWCLCVLGEIVTPGGAYFKAEKLNAQFYLRPPKEDER